MALPAASAPPGLLSRLDSKFGKRGNHRAVMGGVQAGLGERCQHVGFRVAHRFFANTGRSIDVVL